MASALRPPLGGFSDAHREWVAFDRFTDRLQRISDGLVLLEEYSLADLERVRRELESSLEHHRRTWDPVLRTRSPDPRPAVDVDQLRREHDWFRTSLEQLEWFLSLVRMDDYGGQRQAFGQYGRLVAEALRRHLEDEQQLIG